jgi:subtilisin family serine protease
MKRQLLYLIFAMFSLCAFVACAEDNLGVEPSQPEEQPYAQNELLVKFTPQVADLLSRATATRSGAVTRSGVADLDQVMELIGTYQIERVFPVDDDSEALTRESGLHQWYVVRYGNKYTAEQVSQQLLPLGEVQNIDFNRTIKRAYHGKATPLSMDKLQRMSRVTRSETSDPLLPMQWHFVNRGDMFTSGDVVKSVKDADVQCEQAWERSMGDESVIVAVLDEGVFVEHPDLKNNIWVNPNEQKGSMKDNDGNGYAGDYNGYNFARDIGAITWDNAYDSGHGSHVAGVIAAENRNGIGGGSIAGGTPELAGVKVMVCQIFSGNMGSSSIAVARAIKYAADNGAVVLQCSWGYVSGRANEYDWGEAGFDSQEAWEAGAPLEKDALDYFTHNAGSPNGAIEGGIAIFAGGNESAPMAGYPGASDDYISVAATAADFTPAVYTNYGPGISVSAPGGDQDYYYDYVDATHNYGEVGCVLSTLPYHISESGYGYMEGTSMSCPHVSGVVALGVSYATQLRRHFKATELQQMLINTATPIDQYMTGNKFYCRYVADIGPQQPMQLNMSSYKGQMGSGQVNAAAFLAAIDGAGVAMRFPNMYVDLGANVVVAPSRYFVGGEKLTYNVTITKTDIVTCSMQDGKLIFKGVKEGVTSATIKASNGETHKFNITVRKGASSNGWL